MSGFGREADLANLVHDVVSATQDGARAIDGALASGGDYYTIDRETLISVRDTIFASGELNRRLYEENTSIMDRLVELSKKPRE